MTKDKRRYCIGYKMKVFFTVDTAVFRFCYAHCYNSIVCSVQKIKEKAKLIQMFSNNGIVGKNMQYEVGT